MEVIETIIENSPETLAPLANYDDLSLLFEYPHTEERCEKWKEVCTELAQDIPQTAAIVQPFIEFLNNSTLTEVQELFLRSFDVQAITTLDIGYILFGEDYKRGELLVQLNREHREAGNVCETELSDHLPNVLRLLVRMKDQELRSELVSVLLLPALDKMIAEFDNQKIQKKDDVYKKHLKTLIDYSAQYRVAYQFAIQAVYAALVRDFTPVIECECCAGQHEPAHDNTYAHAESCCGEGYEPCGHTKVPADFGGTIENEFNIEN